MKNYLIATIAAPLLGALVLATVCSAIAQEQIDATVSSVGTVANDGPLPAGGELLIGAEPMRALQLEGRQKDKASVEEVAVEGQPFGTALRVKTGNKGASDDSILLSAAIPVPVKSGDTFFLRLWGRTLEGGDAQGESAVTLTIHKAGAPGDTVFFGGTARFGKEWRRFDLPIPARMAQAQPQFSIRVGGATRVVELAGLEAYNYGQRVLPHQLPYKRATYEGREPDAPWRKEAEARIDQHRKGDLTVLVTDTAGKPLPGAQVRVAMKNHAYRFGTAVAGRPMFADTPDGEKYRAAVKQYFNEAVVENDLKWRGWEDASGRAQAIRTVQWLRDNGLTVRGHVVIWPGWRNLPDSLKKLYEDTKAAQGDEAAKAALRKALDAHIVDMVGTMKGQLVDWDVVNETVANNELMKILGREAMIDWYRRVREIDPDAVLYHAENSVESGGKADPFEKDIVFLKEGGAPLGGIGLQGHVGAIKIAQVETILQRFSKHNLDIKITEFDMVTPDEQLQADYTRDFMTVFSRIHKPRAS